MSSLSIQRISVPCVAGAPGTACKNIVSALLRSCGDLQIVEVASDTTSSYDVYLSWRGDPDWRIRVFNSSGSNTLYCYTYFATTNGEYSSYSATSCSLGLGLTGYEAALEIVQAGSDMLIVGVYASYSETTKCGFCCLRVLDQFTAEEKNIYAGLVTDNAYFSFASFSVNSAENGGRVGVTATNGITGFTPNSLTVAVPVVFYTTSALLPLSGFVGTDLLYYIYQGAQRLNYPSRYTRFTIDGHEFVSLGNQLCARVS